MTSIQSPSQSPDPIEEENFPTAEDLLSALSPTNPRWSPYPMTWIFRGHAKSTWQLVPTALRPGRLRAYARTASPLAATPTVAEQIQAEWELLNAFIVSADRAGLSIPEDSQQIRSAGELVLRLGSLISRATTEDSPEWPPNYLLSMFALAQHYGVPTRLLDWTWKPRVAAYFACEGLAVGREAYGPSDWLAIWALRANFVPTVWSSLHPRVRLVTAPQASNPNLHAQAGLFTVDGVVASPKPLEELVREELVRRSSSLPAELLPALRKLCLPSSEAPKLLRLLAYEHTNAATVFPGHLGVVRGLEERWHWDA